MKIMLNGATAGTNFGDYLFAEIFQRKLAEKIGFENVSWYSSRFAYSDFYKNHLKNENKIKVENLDALIYISGGYFCGNDLNWKHFIIRYLSYFRIGLKCLASGIPYGIFGVEVGISKSRIIQCIQKKILNGASIVTVRNQKSYEICKQLGVKNLICTADTVFSMPEEMYKNEEIPDEIIRCKKKKLLLHINPSNNVEILNKIVPIINSFLKAHSEYAVVITMDQYIDSQKKVLEEVANEIECDEIYCYEYNYPVSLCKVIDSCDLIITTKLHVGIVGMKLSKSVISFSGHTEKIERLYAQLNESARSVPLTELTFEMGLQILEKYHNVHVKVPLNIVEDSKQNLTYMDKFIDGIIGDDNN